MKSCDLAGGTFRVLGLDICAWHVHGLCTAKSGPFVGVRQCPSGRSQRSMSTIDHQSGLVPIHPFERGMGTDRAVYSRLGGRHSSKDFGLNQGNITELFVVGTWLHPDFGVPVESSLKA